MFCGFIALNLPTFLALMNNNPAFFARMLNINRFHQSMASVNPVPWVNINMFAPKTLGAVISITIAFDFCAAMFANEIFLATTKLSALHCFSAIWLKLEKDK